MLISINQTIELRQVQEIPGRHWHICPKCQHAWNHVDGSDVFQHRCPKCSWSDGIKFSDVEVRVFAKSAEIARPCKIIPNS